MSKQSTLAADARLKTGKGSARSARRDGKIPAILYSHFSEAVAIAINPAEIKRIVTESELRFNTVVTLDIGGKDKRTALLKDWQVDPLSRQLLHADFLEIRLNEKLEADVSLKLIGKSIGVEDGGSLNQVRRELHIRCLPSDIPAVIEVDISNLGINDSLHVADVTPPEKVELVYTHNLTLAVVNPPEREETPVDADTAPVGAPGADAADAADAAAPEEGGDKA